MWREWVRCEGEKAEEEHCNKYFPVPSDLLSSVFWLVL